MDGSYGAVSKGTQDWGWKYLRYLSWQGSSWLGWSQTRSDVKVAKEILGGIHSGMYEMHENKNSSIDRKYLGLALASRPLFVIWLEKIPLQVLLVLENTDTVLWSQCIFEVSWYLSTINVRINTTWEKF